VRVFSRPDQIEKTSYALETAIKVLEFYENYFGIDYPLEKLGINRILFL
jgi:aminopeptidase N